MTAETLTPDGRPLRKGLCVCTMHCANTCEPACCREGTPWCSCWCHEQRYRLMASVKAAKELAALVEGA